MLLLLSDLLPTASMPLASHLPLAIERNGTSNTAVFNPHVIGSFTTDTIALFHAPITLHGNTHPLYHPIFLLPHVAEWVASYSAPSSILDGESAMLGQPSSHQWKTLLLCPLASSLSCNQPLTHQPLDFNLVMAYSMLYEQVYFLYTSYITIYISFY
jgi:hypothetical protein